MKNITATIIACNEENKIEECIKSVSWCDEIILVDSGSNDNTIKIAQNMGVRVIFNKWEGFAKQKDFALQQANTEWVLSIDADERITEELKNEILARPENDISGYYLKRENYFIGKKITTCGWNLDYQLRLFKKNNTTVSDRLVHEGFIVDGKTEKLNNSMIHLTYDSISQALSKINHYTSLQAKEMKDKNFNIFSIFLRTISQFLRFFISLKGYKDGVHGLILAFFNSITTMLAYSKLWESKLEKKDN